MNVKERILTIRLLERSAKRKELAEALGISPVNKLVISNQQDKIN